jgi:group I intron endonuclease
MEKYGIIYIVINKINSKIYIGKKKIKNINEWKDYWGSGKLIQKAILKYGIENFKKEILEYCYSREELNSAEIDYIEFYNSTNRNIGYNLTIGGEGGKTSDQHGAKRSEQAKLNMSFAQKGKTGNKNSFYGKKHTEESKLKMRLAKIGNDFRKNKKMSEEAKTKISLAMLGKKHTEETKRKISLARRKFQSKQKEVEMLEIKGKYATAKIMIDTVEEELIRQLYKIVNNPAFHDPMVIMPDCHAGKGSVVGFTMPLTDKIIPNTIGVDIGCGMLATRITNGENLIVEFIKNVLPSIEHEIRRSIPFGQNIHKHSILNFEKDFPWQSHDIKWFENKCKQIGIDTRYACNSIGTLGGGNHFIEVGIDLNNCIWFVIHTGSRNFGLKIADFWTDVAQSKDKTLLDLEMKKAIDIIKANASTPELRQRINQDIKLARLKIYGRADKISEELEYLIEADAQGYLEDMVFAQSYAAFNRKIIQKLILKNVFSDLTVFEEIESIHNYIDFKDNVIRKGAISAHKNEIMIIPFNMRDGILICKGKGNEEWNNSAPHGAGRVLARGAAKRTLSLEKFKEQMEGIYSTSVVAATLDEAPDAYKPAAVIEDAIEPTAEIINRIKPLINLKSLN